MTEQVDKTQVKLAADARRWRAMVTTEDGIAHCRIITVPLLTRFIRERRQHGDVRPLKPVLSWLLDFLLKYAEELKSYGSAESFQIKESGRKKRTKTNV